MAAPKGKLTDLSLQAAGLTASFSGAPAYNGVPSSGGATQIDGAGPQAWFGPMQPLMPMAPAGTGGRQFDYRFGANLDYTPRGDAEVTFGMLRNLADSLPILRIVIEKRKDQIAGWDWDIQPILTGKDKRKAASQGQKADPRIAAVRRFLRYPDRRHSFHAWMRMLLEDMLVIDAAAIYPRKTRMGGLYSLDVVDGATITPLINGDGRAPLPDEGPAYQQILHGIPAADFTLDELRYLPRNVRSNRLYGLSPVEQVVLTINIALRREIFNLEYYNTGSLPDAFGSLPKEWTVDQVKQFQDYFDALMSGDLGRRRKLKFMPADFKMMEVRSPPLKDQYDEWLTRVICAAFSIPASPFVAEMNRATAQTVQITASQEGIEPLQGWIKDWMDGFIQVDMGFDDLEFVWSGNDKTDPLVQAQCDASDVNAGIKSRDEVRVERGLDPYGIGPTVSGPIIPLLEGYNQAVETIKNPPPPVAPANPSPAAPGGPRGASATSGDASALTAKEPAARRPATTPKGARSAGNAQKVDIAESADSVDAAGVMYHAPSGSVLFLLRAKKGGDAGGTWAFPGGGVEEGETDEQAVARESEEEIGFTPDVWHLTLAHTGSNGYRTFSCAVSREFTPTLNPEHDAYAWADPCHPPQPLHPGVRETLTSLDYLGVSTRPHNGLRASQDMPLAKTEGRMVDGPPFDRPAVEKSVGTYAEAIAAALVATREAVVAQLRATRLGKASSDDDGENPSADDARIAREIDALSELAPGERPAAIERIAEHIADSLDLSTLESLAAHDATPTIAADAVRETIATLGVEMPGGLVDQVNARAVAAAKDRAAELVGMRVLEDGSIVANPNAEMAITHTMREAIRQTIADGLADNIGRDGIIEAIEALGNFGDDRATTIAETEIARANSSAALASYKGAASLGILVKKAWLTAAAKVCDFCAANARQGPIGLELPFSSGDDCPPGHVRCHCALSAEVYDDAAKGYSPAEPRDKAGRWTAYVLAEHGQGVGNEPLIHGVFASRAEARRQAAGLIRAARREGEEPPDLIVHEADAEGAAGQGAKVHVVHAGDHVQAAGGASLKQPVAGDVHGVYADKGDARAAQREASQAAWSAHGPEWEYFSHSTDAEADRVDRAWASAHSDDSEGTWRRASPQDNEAFARQVLGRAEGGKADYPGLRAANEHFEQAGDTQHAVYLSATRMN